jgi:hypothetical protein
MVSVFAETYKKTNRDIRNAVSDLATFYKRNVQTCLREASVKALIVDLHTRSLKVLMVWVWSYEIKWR